MLERSEFPVNNALLVASTSRGIATVMEDALKPGRLQEPGWGVSKKILLSSIHIEARQLIRRPAFMHC